MKLIKWENQIVKFELVTFIFCGNPYILRKIKNMLAMVYDMI